MSPVETLHVTSMVIVSCILDTLVDKFYSHTDYSLIGGLK